MAANTMRTISLRNLGAHKVRLLLTILSVVLGTAFIAGSSMLTTSLSSSFTDITKNVYQNVDVVVTQTEKSPLGIPFSDVEKLRNNPDVRAVEVSSSSSNLVMAGPDGKAVQSMGAPSTAIAQAPDGKQVSDVATITDGVMPTEANTVAINSTAAERGNIKVGDTVTIVTPSERIQPKVVGIYETEMQTGGFIGVVFEEQEFMKHFTDGEHLSSLSVGFNDGVNKDDAQKKLADEMPDYKVENGQKLADDMNKAVTDALAFLNYFLWAFAAIALLVGTFIISNTFSMIVAQRNREFALLRSVGTSRTQITTSVVFEAIMVGIVGSLIGIAAGAGLTKLLQLGMKQMEMGFPDSGVHVDWQSIVIPLVVGTFVTVISAWAPARRAGSIHPVQAMRSGDQSSNNSLKIRTLIGALFIIAGTVAAALGGMNEDLGGIKERAITVGVGAVAIILGLWLAGPALSIPVVGGIGRVVGAPFGAVGKLAATNSRRNPRRTAATAFALMLGLMLVSSIGMMGATMKSSINDMIKDNMHVDYMLRTPQNMPVSMPPDVPNKVAKIADVDKQYIISLAPITANEPPSPEQIMMMPPTMGVADSDVGEAVAVEMIEGSSDLTGKDALIIDEDRAKEWNVKVGDEVKVYSVTGRESTAPVTGIFKKNPTFGTEAMSKQSALKLLDERDMTVFQILVKAKEGADKDKLRTELEDATKEDIIVTIMDQDDFKGEINKGINQMLNILYALLALSVVVAILGIINTLALSVSERRQEIGMLRAVGTRRSQINYMIYIESAVIALYGALVGSVVGLGLGWAFLKTLHSMGIDTVTVPWTQVGLMVLASGIVGVIAALLPAYRAAQTKPLEAIHE